MLIINFPVNVIKETFTGQSLVLFQTFWQNCSPVLELKIQKLFIISVYLHVRFLSTINILEMLWNSYIIELYIYSMPICAMYSIEQNNHRLFMHMNIQKNFMHYGLWEVFQEHHKILCCIKHTRTNIYNF